MRYSAPILYPFSLLSLAQVTNLLQDYDAAAGRAEAFDSTLLQSAGRISSHYADLVALAARQAMAGVELTIGRNDDGSYNYMDVKMFMKNVGTDKSVRLFRSARFYLPFVVKVVLTLRVQPRQPSRGHVHRVSLLSRRQRFVRRMASGSGT